MKVAQIIRGQSGTEEEGKNVRIDVIVKLQIDGRKLKIQGVVAKLVLCALATEIITDKEADFNLWMMWGCVSIDIMSMTQMCWKSDLHSHVQREAMLEAIGSPKILLDSLTVPFVT